MSAPDVQTSAPSPPHCQHPGAALRSAACRTCRRPVVDGAGAAAPAHTVWINPDPDSHNKALKRNNIL